MTNQRISLNNILIKFDLYVPQEEWNTIDKVAINFREIKWLKLFCFGCKKYYKKYALKVVYKDSTVKYFSLTFKEKNSIKSHVVNFNWFIKDLQDVSKCFPI